jgi:hypothetical protein
MAVDLHQSRRWVAASDHHAVGEADSRGAVQPMARGGPGMSGDRYWSRVVEGEPPEGALEVDWAAVDVAAETGILAVGKSPSNGVSPLVAENPAETGFSPQNPARSPPPSG